MIVDVHKYLIYGVKYDLDEFFEKAQKAGFIEFISSVKKKVAITPAMQNLLSAIKVLKKRPVKSMPESSVPLAPEVIADHVVHASEALERLFEEERMLQAEISRISVFGNFLPEDIAFIEREGKRYLQFFCMKTSRADEIVLPPEMIYIGTEYDLDYFVAINKERKSYPGMIELIIEKPLGYIESHLQVVKEQIAKFEHELKNYTAYLDLLKNELVVKMNEYHLASAKKEIIHPMGESLFAVEAWIPDTKVKSMHALIGQLGVSFEEIKIEEKDFKPTYMENKGFGLIGEDIVNIYDIPSATDKDPSRWVFWLFALFFAMIVADAGYGLVYLALSLFIKFKFPRLTGFGKRFVSLMITLSLFCIGWGVFTASFFGVEIGPNNPYRKFSPLHYLAQKKAEYHMAQKDDVYEAYLHQFPDIANAKDGHDFLLLASIKEPDGKIKYEALNDFYDNILMEISLVVGMIHVILAFMRYLLRNWAGAGWILFIIGGYLFFPSILKATTMLNFLGIISKPVGYKLGEQLIYGGIALAILLAFIQKKMGGLHEIMNVIQIFADVLSYLRLYALALAGMIMASTFNDMGLDIGLGVGFLIIFVGHAINIVIGIMGGVIHGLRLNFLEWYHYCFEGGGKKFNPLRLLKRS